MENNENKTPVVEAEKQETTTSQEPVKTEEKPVEKKEKKSLFAPKKKPWEEDKPKEPLDTQDMLCIAGFVFFLILAFTPYFLRFLDSSYDETKKFSLKEDDSKSQVVTKTTRKKLICNKNVNESASGYNYTVDIENLYENGEVTVNKIVYKVEIVDPAVSINDVQIEEFETLSNIKSDGVKVEHIDGTDTYSIEINYNLDASLKTNAELSSHFKAFGIQKSDYEEEQGYTCTDEKLEG